MKVKVCGMREPDNIQDILSGGPDYIGFIFYDKSKRYVSEQTLSYLQEAETTAKKVGVFVNEDLATLIKLAKKYNLDFVQLHGNESPDYVGQVAQADISIIKAFNIHEEFDWSNLEKYLPDVAYFLFDTASAQHGGSGKKFDWTLLEKYTLDKPFFLSGGISLADAHSCTTLNHPSLETLDINSRFETKPGYKDKEQVLQFLKTVR